MKEPWAGSWMEAMFSAPPFLHLAPRGLEFTSWKFPGHAKNFCQAWDLTAGHPGLLSGFPVPQGASDKDEEDGAAPGDPKPQRLHYKVVGNPFWSRRSDCF